jgi:hypothetical protein
MKNQKEKEREKKKPMNTCDQKRINYERTFPVQRAHIQPSTSGLGIEAVK